MSILRAPMLQPPGMATTALPKRETKGPSTAVEARICATKLYGVSPLVHACGIDAQLMNVNDLYLCPKALEDLAHDVHVCDVGDVAQGRHPWAP